jgi:hypothetical protein
MARKKTDLLGWNTVGVVLVRKGGEKSWNLKAEVLPLMVSWALRFQALLQALLKNLNEIGKESIWEIGKIHQKDQDRISISVPLRRLTGVRLIRRPSFLLMGPHRSRWECRCRGRDQ